MLLESMTTKGESGLDVARARSLLLKHGWNTTCFQILNPGIELWFSDAGDAVAGFVSANGYRVVGGAPACSLDRLQDVADEFENDAASHDERVCYFLAEARLESALSRSPDHSFVLLGAQPVWDPATWPTIVRTHGSLRAQLNRARNKNVEVVEWPIEKARNNPALRHCLDAWLSSKGLPPLHFMVEPDTLGRLENRRVFVAERSEKVVGFIVLSPVPTRSGWLTEQFPHLPGAPNGTVELMMDAVFRALAEDGCKYVTLGLSPLSHRAKIEPFDNPLWLRIFLGWMRKHGQRFYNFDGLDRFKSKLMPNYWEPIFAISNETKFSGSTLYAIGCAFTENKPVRIFASGLKKAVVTEVGNVRRWLFG
jgi:phosphatidylglycerol lysyltransferase